MIPQGYQGLMKKTGRHPGDDGNVLAHAENEDIICN
jgi:hypothetical protein